MATATMRDGITASFSRAVTLTKVLLLANIYNNGDLNLTPLLSGSMGQGKSSIAKKVAEAFAPESASKREKSQRCVVVDGSLIQDGDVSGVPYLSDIMAGNIRRTTLSYALYPAFESIKRMQEYIYNKAKTTGFLNGTIKILDDGRVQYPINNKEFGYIPAKTEEEKVFDGEENKYLFGEELPGEIKLKLIKSGEIPVYILFFDEINRSSALKEIMNVTLTHMVHEWKLPWWVMTMAASNPSGGNFNVNSFDPANIDRFTKIPVSQDPNEWMDYQLDKGSADPRYLYALGQDMGKIFAPTNSDLSEHSANTDNTYDEERPMPSPRSHELLATLMNNANNIKNSGFFTVEERNDFENIIADIISDKLGASAGRIMNMNIKHAVDYVDPKDVFTGDADVIPAAYASKIRNMSIMSQQIFIKSAINYLASPAMLKPHAYKKAKLTDITLLNKYKAMAMHLTNQVTDFVNNVVGGSPANQLHFVRLLNSTKLQFDDEIRKVASNRVDFRETSCLFTIYSDAKFTADVLSEMRSLNNAVDKQ